MKLYDHDRKPISVKKIDDIYSMLITGIILIGIGVYLIIINDYGYGTISIVSGIVICVISIYKLKNRKIKNLNTTYYEIIDDVNSGRIKFEFINLGLDEEKFDYINEGTNICFGYAYDETCFFNAIVSKDYYEFAIELTDEMYDADADKFEKAFSEESDDIIDVYEGYDFVHASSKVDIYLAFIDFINKNQNKIEMVAREARVLLDSESRY